MEKGEGNPRNFSGWSPVLPGSPRVFPGSAWAFQSLVSRFPGQGKGEVVTKS